MNVKTIIQTGLRTATVGIPVVGFLALLFSGVLSPEALGAQVTTAPRQMRHFWHVFIAYGIGWGVLLAWLVSILRRVRRIEERLRQ